MIKKIFQQTFWQILGKVASSLSTFIILGLVARNYGEAGTGIFTLALTYLAIFYLLSDFGFNAHVLKRLQVTGDRVQKEWQKLLGTRILWSVALVILSVGTLPFWSFASPQFNQAVLSGSLAIIASGIFVTCNLIFQKKLRYDLSVLASSIGTLISLGFFIYFASLHYPIQFLLLAHLLGWIIIAIAALFLVKGGLPTYDIRYTINLFKDSWPVAFTLVLNVIYFRADVFILAYFKGVSDVGIYNLAYSIFQTALVLPAFIMNAYYPLMLKSVAEVKKVGLGLLILSVSGTFLTIIFAPFFTNLITGGRGFTGSAASLQILSLGFPAFFLSSLLMWLMVTKGRYKLMLSIYAIGLLANLVFNFLYIPLSSYMAASWITVISEYLILILLAVSLLL